MPRGPHLAVEQPEIGFLIAGEVFLLRVPDELAVEVHGDLAQVAERIGMH